MARFVSPHHQVTDSNGDPVSGAKVYFYDTGTSTPKTTYSDSDETTANSNPVIADGNGYLPAIYFSGTARVVFKTSSDVLLPNGDIDPFELSSTDAPFSAYNAGKTYAANEVVLSGGVFYISIQGSNQGNTPSSSAAYWTQLSLVKKYNSNETYASGDLVQGSDNVVYRSASGANLGNDPTTSVDKWKREGERTWKAVAATYSAKAEEKIVPDNSAGVATITLPSSPEDGQSILIKQKEGSLFSVNKCTISRNGKPIMGLSEDMDIAMDNVIVGLTYFNDATGWRAEYLGTIGN